MSSNLPDWPRGSNFLTPWNRFFETPWSRIFDEGLSEFTNRGVRIYEQDNQLKVEVPIAGINPDEIEVSLSKGVLMISGESKQTEEDKKKKYHRYSERKYGYSIALPTQIDESQEPQADYNEGILTVSLQVAKPHETRKIPVQSRKKKS